MKRITIGAVKVPKSIDHIQVGPKGAVSTPARLMRRENAASITQSLGVKMLLLSMVFVSALIANFSQEEIYKLFSPLPFKYLYAERSHVYHTGCKVTGMSSGRSIT
jgi:glutamate formiminotransferase